MGLCWCQSWHLLPTPSVPSLVDSVSPAQELGGIDFVCLSMLISSSCLWLALLIYRFPFCFSSAEAGNGSIWPPKSLLYCSPSEGATYSYLHQNAPGSCCKHLNKGGQISLSLAQAGGLYSLTIKCLCFLNPAMRTRVSEATAGAS